MNMETEPRPSIVRRSLGLFLIIFVLSGAFVGGIVMIFYRSEVSNHLNNLKKQETFSIKLQSQTVEDILDTIVGDLHFLQGQNELQEFLASRETSHLDKIAEEYKSLAMQKKIYDQVRFLDKNGMEIVKIDYNQGHPIRVPVDELEHKGNRYYFKDCYEIDKGEIFISPFALDMENGVIETPYKPIIRMGTPVVDSKGNKRGIVLLNYMGDDLIMKVLESEGVSEGITMMLNSRGYWIIGPNPEQEWGFMFKDEKRSFSAKYGTMWEKIRENGNGQIQSPEGLFTYNTIYPSKAGHKNIMDSSQAQGKSTSRPDYDEYVWYMVSFVPAHSIDAYSKYLLNKLFPFGIAVFLLVSNWSWLIAFAITKRRIFQEQLRAMALFDSLTGLPNRRLFFDRLNIMIEQSKRYNNMFALLFVDLDGFKIINDTFGHEAGDELLCQVADILRMTLRKSDTVARLGGDEFAVILAGIKNARGAEVAAKKIIASLSIPMILRAGSGRIGASIGISLFPYDSEDSETLLRIADKYMYESKHKGKNTYTLTSIDIQ